MDIEKREIKFRAWNRESKTMGKTFTLEGLAKITDYGKEALANDILMQFTGLKDKKGVEIYEEDILKLDGGGELSLGSVGFERGCFVFNADWFDKDKEYMPELYRYTFFAELKKGKLFKDCVVVEVIGNVWENPDLIKEKV